MEPPVEICIDNPLEKKKFQIRPGTNDVGRLYEVKVAALLSLRCANHAKTVNMWMTTNANEIGDLDDVVLVRTTEDETIAYMMQLKHRDKHKKILPSDFLKNKDFEIMKYCKSFKELNIKINDCQDNQAEIIKCLRDAHKTFFVLYTNMDVNSCKCKFLKNYNTNKNYIDLLTTPITSGEGTISTIPSSDRYTFDHDHAELKEYDPEFLKQLILLPNQPNVNSLNEKIKDEIKYRTRSLALTDTEIHIISDKFLKFIEKWAQSNSRKQYFLTKGDIANKLADLLLKDYRINLSKENFNFHDLPYKCNFNEIVSDKAFTIIDRDDKVFKFLKQYIYDEITKNCKDLKSYSSSSLSQNLKQLLFHTDTNDNLKIHMFKILGNPDHLSFLDIYKCMWLDNQLPLLLKIKTSQDYKTIMKILELFDYNFRVILLNETTQPLPNIDTKLKHFQTFDDLNNVHKNMLLNKHVKLQGRSSVLLSELVDDSMFPYITSNNIINILLDDFNIGNDYQPPPNDFIERRFYRMLINSEVLNKIKDEIFLIEKPCQLDFNTLCVDKSRICNLDDIDNTDFNNTNVIIAKIHEVLETVHEKIHASSGKTIHLLRLDDANRLEWKKTLGKTNNIKLFQFNNNGEVDYQLTYTMEEMCQQPDNTQILSASPGMGKSTSMDCLAHRVPTNMWMLKIDLNQHETYYASQECKDSETQTLAHLKYFNDEILKKHNCSTQLTQAIFQKFLDTRKVFIILDGFDEISSFYEKQVTNIAKRIQQEGFKMWVTTRPVMESHLEEELNSISTSLKSYTPDDQKTFLKKYFYQLYITQESDTKCDDAIMERFVEELLEATALNLNDKDFEFTGIPLQTKLLADAFSNDCMQSLKSNTIQFNKNFDLLDLYEKFIKTKMDIVYNKPNQQRKHMLPGHKKYQSFCALRLLFHEEDLKKLNIEEELDNYKKVNADDSKGIQSLQSDGVMVGENEFVHRTFAEYIAAKWLFANFNSDVDKVRETVQIILNERFDQYYKFLFNIFDRMASKNSPAHLAIINGHLEEAYTDIKSSTNKVIPEDELGRSLLHIIAIYGDYCPSQTFYDSLVTLNRDTNHTLRNTVRLLLRDRETNLKNDKFGYSPLDYAIANGSLAIANTICEHPIALNISVKIAFELKEKYLLYCAMMDYPYLFKTLLKYFAYIELVEDDSLQGTDDIRDYIEDLLQFASGRKFIIEKLEDFFKKLDLITITKLSVIIMTDKCYRVPYYFNLHLAAAYSTEDDINHLITKGFQINKDDIFLNTPLHYAVLFQRSEIVDLLVLKGANVDIQNDNGFTPLHLAVEKKQLDILNTLLNHGAKVDIRDVNNETPLELAMRLDIPDIKAVLTKHSSVSDLSNIIPYEDKPGRIYVDHKIIDVLIDSINYDQMESERRLRSAIAEENLLEIQRLISSGADINNQNYSGDTHLHWAVKYGNTEIVMLFLKNKADVNIPNNDGNTALHCAILENDEDNTKLFLADNVIVEKGENTNSTMSICSPITNRYYNVKNTNNATLQWKTDINKQNGSNETPLMLAVLEGNLDITKLLASKGADVNMVNDSNFSALHFAACNGYSDIASLLLQEGADINVQTDNNDTPLHCAVGYNNADIAKLFLSKGADVNIIGSNGNNVLHLASWMCSEEIVSLLLDEGVKINNPKQLFDQKTALHLAIERNHIDIVKLLLSRGADITVKDFQENNVIHYAALYNFQGVSWVLSDKVALNAKNKDGYTPLHLAVKNRHKLVAEQLIFHGANINIRDFEGNTALHIAVLSNSENDIISTLLSGGAEINLKNNFGYTPLYLAVKQHYTFTTKLFLDNGADANTNCFKRTVLHEAAENGFDEIISLLLVACAKLDVQDYNKLTPLHYALARGHEESSKLLLCNGADTNIPDCFGNTALHYAAKNHLQDSIRIILVGGDKINKQNNDKRTPLHLAVGTPLHLEFRTPLHLAVGTPLHLAVGTPLHLEVRTPLHLVVVTNHLHTSKLLLSKGADINISDSKGNTVLHDASNMRYEKIVNLLLVSGADVNKQNNNGNTPLHYTIDEDQGIIVTVQTTSISVDGKMRDPHYLAQVGLQKIISLLLFGGAEINKQNNWKSTPLHLAVRKNYPHTLKLLLSKGAHTNTSDISGNTVLHQASKNGYEKIVSLLLFTSADVNKKNNYGDTSLHCAVDNGHVKTAALLLFKGADVNIINHEGKTVRDIAISRGRKEMIILTLIPYKVVYCFLHVYRYVKTKNTK